MAGQYVVPGLDELIELVTGNAAPTDEALAALAEATGIPREQLESNLADPEAGQPATDPLRCLTVKQVAALLQVSEETVEKRWNSGWQGGAA